MLAMISEEMLSQWEDALQWSDTNDWDDVITSLIEEVRHLKKEADWLAGFCETLSGWKRRSQSGMPRDQWREEARKAASHD